MNKLILLLSVFLSVSLFSCDNNEKDDPTPPKPTANELTYIIPDLGPLLEMVDITIEYTTADGTKATETIKDKIWTKKITGFKIPFDPAVKITYVKKAGFVAEDKKYLVTTGINYSYKLSTGQERYVELSWTKAISTKAGIEKFVTDLVATPKTYTIDVPYK